MHWLSAHPSFSDSPRVSILTSLSAFGTKPLEGGLVGKKQVMFIPAPGDHLVAYKDRWGGVVGLACGKWLAELLRYTWHCRRR